MVEVRYHRVKIKKTPRKKKKAPVQDSSYRDESLYYVLDKKVNYGEMCLTANSVFASKEFIELDLFVPRHQAKLRLLAKVLKLETFTELKRPMFRGDLKFSAVNKYDFEKIKALEEERLQKEAAFKAAFPNRVKKDSAPPKNSMRLTFKKG